MLIRLHTGAKPVPNTFSLPYIAYAPLRSTRHNTNIVYDPSSDIKPPSISHSDRSLQSWRPRFSGWRGGVVISIGITLLVLVLNVVVAILAATTWSEDEETDSAKVVTAFSGDCKYVTRVTTALHLVVNLLSSLLLGASNYCMQRLVAPTRKEIDVAHARRQYLDIGIPSMRNLGSISRARMLLWTLLALSSVPLHFV